VVAAAEGLRVEAVDMDISPGAEAEGDVEAAVENAFGRLEAVDLGHDINHLASAGYNRPVSVEEGGHAVNRHLKTART
jgi:hypothetical protein